MKFSRVQIALFLIAVASLIAVVLFNARMSAGQSRAAARSSGEAVESRVKPTVLVREPNVETRTGTPPASSPFGSAAMRNAQLLNDLDWTFGGKHQRGWYLYTPLIGRLLRTEADPDSVGFASALASWQERLGLNPSGVLDEDSIYAMVSEWQGQRLKERSPADPGQLIVAPASDFYDPARIDELRQVERETYAAYKRMIVAAVADPALHLASDPNGQLALTEKYLKIVSSFRTREYQEQLRRQSPNAGRAGLAVNSPHFTGRALDLYVGGDPVDTRDSNRALQVETPVYHWLVCNAERFGFRPYYYEPWHWEYTGLATNR
jgi:hypothetical protein